MNLQVCKMEQSAFVGMKPTTNKAQLMNRSVTYLATVNRVKFVADLLESVFTLLVLAQQVPPFPEVQAFLTTHMVSGDGAH